jgi:transcriptional regulator with XRE-family HTH domain
VELLAYFLNIPLEHFWGNTALSEKSMADDSINVEQLVEIRQKLIGVTLRQAREQAQLTLEDVADGTGLSAEELEAVEYGQKPVSLPKLEYLSSYFNLQIRDLQDKHGPVGAKVGQQRTVQDFLTLPPDIQAFVAKPINRPYLELAQRLSEMSVEKLRAVGEGILEITL